MKTIKSIIITLLVTILCGCSNTTNNASQSAPQEELPVIGVIQLMEHTSLNQIYDSFINQLAELGYIDNETCILEFHNAQGEMTNITTIVQGFQGTQPDVVVAIATPTAQTAMSLTDTIPVIFSAVTDPVDAGLVSSLDAPDHNMTGTSDAVQVDQIIDLALSIQPDAKTVGYLYNPGEANSVSNLTKLQEYASEKGLTIVDSGVTSAAELSTAAAVLCGQVDFIFVGNDNTVASSMPALGQEALKTGTPVYTGADSMVKDGGFATVGIDYTDLGKETANMVDEVLHGTAVSDIPVKVFDENLFIYVNESVKEQLQISLPDSITSSDRYIEITE